jgi:hypothetical protein
MCVPKAAGAHELHQRLPFLSPGTTSCTLFAPVFGASEVLPLPPRPFDALLPLPPPSFPSLSQTTNLKSKEDLVPKQ